MPYRIFLSHVSEDARIARAIKAAIVNAFDGHIDIYLAHDEIAAGEPWKKAIVSRLADSDAIICVITRDSRLQPWILVEWSAFWLEGKTYYVLIADDVAESELFEPMQERQATRLSEESQVRRLFAYLNEVSGHETVPFRHVPILMESVQAARVEKERMQYERSYAVYRDVSRPLPASDREKEQVAEFFMANGERDHFARVCRELRDDEIKTRIAHRLVKARNAGMIAIVADRIEDAGRLQEIARQMIDMQMTDGAEFRALADDLAKKNQAEYRKVLLHLIDRGEEGTKLFQHLAASMSNMAETRKIGEYLIQNRKGFQGPLSDVVSLMGRFNRVELRKLVTEMVYNGVQGEPVFDQAMQTLAAGSQRETEKAMLVLREADEAAFTRLLELGIVTDEAILGRLRALA